MYLRKVLTRFKENKSGQSDICVILGWSYTMKDKRETSSQAHIDFQKAGDRVL